MYMTMIIVSVVACLIMIFWAGLIGFNKLSAWCKHQLDTGGNILCLCHDPMCNNLDHKLAIEVDEKYIIKEPTIKCEKCFIGPAIKINGLGEHVCVQC